jgi:predicted amidohydrolase
MAAIVVAAEVSRRNGIHTKNRRRHGAVDHARAHYGWEIPGFALHQEFDQLAAAGLTPLRILQTTTLNAAEFLGRTDTTGTVEPGKAADLVLLSGDPIDDVANLHGIAGVVRAGQYYSPEILAATVESVADTRCAV